jgi:hypothetical protein
MQAKKKSNGTVLLLQLLQNSQKLRNLKMSKVTNKQIATRLRAAVKELAKNERQIYSTYKQVFICRAVEETTGCWWMASEKEKEEVCAIKKIIHDRIKPCQQLEHWLIRVGNIPERNLTSDKVQAYRHAWLQSLIAEFSTKK